MDMHRAVKNSSPCRVGVDPGDSLRSCCRSQALNKCPLHGLLGAKFSTFLRPVFVMSLLKMTGGQSANVLSGACKSRKSVMCLTEKIMSDVCFLQA